MTEFKVGDEVAWHGAGPFKIFSISDGRSVGFWLPDGQPFHVSLTDCTPWPTPSPTPEERLVMAEHIDELTVADDDEGFGFESCSVEVWRWGRRIRLAIRSEDSVGKCIELELGEAMELSQRLVASVNADKRRIRDEPQA